MTTLGEQAVPSTSRSHRCLSGAASHSSWPAPPPHLYHGLGSHLPACDRRHRESDGYTRLIPSAPLHALYRREPAFPHGAGRPEELARDQRRAEENGPLTDVSFATHIHRPLTLSLDAPVLSSVFPTRKLVLPFVVKVMTTISTVTITVSSAIMRGLPGRQREPGVRFAHCRNMRTKKDNNVSKK